jgi:transcriptional regulator with XRE-family HTH domain
MNYQSKAIKISKAESDQLGQNICQLLKERQISDNQLAEDLHLPIITIRRIITGETHDPRISTLKLIANYFDITIDELLDERKNIPVSFIENNKPQFLPKLDWTTASQIQSIKDLDLASWKNWHPITFGDEYQVSEKAFILESTPSMYPRYSPGTLFVIDPNALPLDGDILLIKRKKNGDIFLRELMIDFPERRLLSIAQNSTDVTFSEEDYLILGVVVLTLLYKRNSGA